MEINIALILLMIIFVFVCIKYKKVILLLPYLLMLFFTGIYNILDNLLFVNVFGCGCNPQFNANDLRYYVYMFLIFVIGIIALILSKKIKKIYFKLIYVFSSIFLNYFLAIEICKLYLWM